MLLTVGPRPNVDKCPAMHIEMQEEQKYDLGL